MSNGDADNPTIIILGPSNSGKSSLLGALSHCADQAGQSSAGYECRLDNPDRGMRELIQESENTVRAEGHLAVATSATNYRAFDLSADPNCNWFLKARYFLYPWCVQGPQQSHFSVPDAPGGAIFPLEQSGSDHVERQEIIDQARMAEGLVLCIDSTNDTDMILESLDTNLKRLYEVDFAEGWQFRRIAIVLTKAEKFFRNVEGYLGVMVVARSNKSGLKIIAIGPDSPAMPAKNGGKGLKVNETIVRINDKTLTSVDDLNVFEKLNPPGTKFDVYVQRGEKTERIPLTLGEQPDKGYLGVVAEADQLGLKVVSFTPNSPAQKAGFLKDDVIIKINKVKLASVEDLSDFQKLHPPGTEITVTVQRDKEIGEISVVLGKTPKEGYLGLGVPKADKHGLTTVPFPPNSPAQKAGLREGDLILTIDNQTLTSVEELRVFEKLNPPGKRVIALVERGTQSINFPIVLGAPPEEKLRNRDKNSHDEAENCNPWRRLKELFRLGTLKKFIQLARDRNTVLACGWVSAYGFNPDGTPNYWNNGRRGDDLEECMALMFDHSLDYNQRLDHWRPFQILDPFVFLLTGELGTLRLAPDPEALDQLAPY